MPQQTMMSMLGRPLTPGEDIALSRMIQERMEAETELTRLKGEQQKLAIESERTKQATIARAIESLAPRWEYERMPVDVGTFQGRQVAVGPMGVRPFGPKVQRVEPGEAAQRRAQMLANIQLGLPAEDPMDVFGRQLTKLEETEKARTKREEERDIRREKRERVAAKEREALEEVKAKEREKLEETKEAGRLRKDLQTKVETSISAAKKAYDDAVKDLRKDPMFKNLPPIEQKSQLAELRAEYEDWVDSIYERAQAAAANYGVTLKLPKLKREKEPSAFSSEQIAQYKKLSTKDKRRFTQLYEQEYGKAFPMEVK